MGFWKVIYKNVKKKNRQVTDILKFYEVLFCTNCTFCTYFKKQPLCLYSSVYA